MDVSGLNVRIVIQKNDVVIDNIGNHTNTWKDFFKCWATVRNRTGEEEDKAGQTIGNERADFTVRYSSETAVVTADKYRILLNDRIYNIVHVDDMGFKRNSRKFSAVLVRR